MRPGRKHRTSKTLGIVLVVGVIAAGTYAFTAANTVDASKAGDGAAAITGFDVGEITYSANSLDPTLIDSVSFDLDAAATTVRARFVNETTLAGVTTSTNGPWSALCTTVTGTTVAGTWSCAFTGGYATADADRLQVVSYE